MTTRSPADDPTLPRRFAEQGAVLKALHARQAALHRALADAPDAKIEAQLAELSAERDAALRAWGMMALRWLVLGGHVELIDPAAQASGLLGSSALLMDDDADRTFAGGREPEDLTSDVTNGLRLDGLDSPSTGVSSSGSGSGSGADDEEDAIDISVVESLIIGGNWGSESYDPGFSIEALREIILRLGPPRDNLTHDDLLAEAAVLDTELNRITRWGQFPRTIQRALLGLVACRMRRLQDDTPSTVRAVLELQLRRGFARLTQFSSEYQPGWVTGLSRQHRPESDSWFNDAMYWWNSLQRELGSLAIEQHKANLNPEISLNELRSVVERSSVDPGLLRKQTRRALQSGVSPDDPRLVRLLDPHMAALGGDRALKRVRRAIREQQLIAKNTDEPEASASEVWSFYERTRGRVAVMVGGEPREQRRQEVMQAMGFEQLEWISGYEIRAVQALADRISAGKISFVLLLSRFINHKITDIVLPACNKANVEWVMVRQGYGLSQIKMAVERFLGDRGEDETI